MKKLDEWIKKCKDAAAKQKALGIFGWIGKALAFVACAIAAVAGLAGPEVRFLDRPSWRGLPHMLRHLRDFRRRPVEALILAPAFLAFVLRRR